MKKGLFSVTFRSLGRSEITELTKKAGLDSVIWGGDVHVPHGEFELAENTKKLCDSFGVSTEVYGSYHKLTNDDYNTVFDTAIALGSNVVRVWAGTKGSADMPTEERDVLVRRLREAADVAKEKGLTLAFEYHGGTLTDDAESAVRLINEAERDNVRLHWQPNQYRDFDFNVRALKTVVPFVDAVHVFAWKENDRFPLAVQEHEWRTYFDILTEHGKCSLAALEFVPVECRDDLMRDAETLDKLIRRTY